MGAEDFIALSPTSDGGNNGEINENLGSKYTEMEQNSLCDKLNNAPTDEHVRATHSPAPKIHIYIIYRHHNLSLARRGRPKHTMAPARYLLLSLLLLAVVFQLVHSDTLQSAEETPQLVEGEKRIDCRPACDYRCSKSWKLNMCKKMCAICCNKCNCVPDGPTVEARAKACPCYVNMKNPKGFNKCP